MQTMQIATSRAAASDVDASQPVLTTGREAKRERTRLRVERAAVRLALELGSEHVTVDQICEESDISPRTFFNYFGSRDAAIVGPANKVPPHDLLDRFVEGNGPLLRDFLEVFAESVRRREPNIDLIRARRVLFEREPQLAMHRMTREANARDIYVDVFVQRLLREDPTMSVTEANDEAVIAVAVALGVVHAAGSSWIESGGTADMHPLIDKALERLRRLV